MRVSKRAVNGLSRRQFLIMTSIAATNLALGCATNPVTGKSQFMLMDEQEEIAIDKQYSPQQFSTDYGTVQDQRLQDYIQTTGKAMAAKTHRPQMPYDFHCVNANYVNAYAFPGGSIACTRGILLDLENEAELAALLGHELGHVNARHTAASMSKAKVANAAVGGLTILTSVAVGSSAGNIAGQLGQLGSGALLASYSRDNERQADHLGMEYMTRTGYGPQGMVGLMDMLNSMSQHKASATELLFATHPMSSERYKTAVAEAKNDYQKFDGQPLHRERYMDHTAGLRKIQGAVKKMQEGEAALGQEKYTDAEGLFKQALTEAPNDYVGLLLMSKCLLMQKKNKDAQRYAEKAKQVYPAEAQAYHISGFAKFSNEQYEEAFEDFSTYEKRLPGDPNTTFYQGMSLEGMQKIQDAAKAYSAYLKHVNQGQQAQYAAKRLKEWGYTK
ncbi:peptidase M48 [Desulfosarcina variabilis str. Montpellier]|uniref:M48 family metalloprotease n=1 Tax=Desulfosarcina variabilis TaxID=2300 RepID=UPI003AFAE3C3